MNLDMEMVLKLLVVGGLISFILLLISFQFIFAVIVLIIVIVSYYLLRKDQGSA